ncbi:MAG: NADP-dependent malic enzyme [Firmicutes bacterium]|nr:NADP-dependent malic enzyme [Bacillota bacterium]
MDYGKLSLEKHYEWKGKLDIVPKVKVETKNDLSLAYTPGVATPCLVIQKDITQSYTLTGRGNLVAVITDGTAVLGLGDIGPEAGMPVMEGKCVLLKTFGGVDAIPLCIRSKDPEVIIQTVALLAGNFGGINLEDISAPRCFEIETRLKAICDIPVFHDDQHGTAIVVGAALLNALQVVHKKIASVRIVINGAGAAGISIARFLKDLGAENIILVDRFGIVCEGETWMNPVQAEMAKITNRNHLHGLLATAMKDSDVFIGVSVGKIVSEAMIGSMAKGSIVFPLANPTPEISREEALHAGAAVVGTGSSDQPNQINNLLVFPGIFRGALDVRASDINHAMMIAAAYGIASIVTKEELKAEYILPAPFDRRVHAAVASKVAQAARDSGVARI